MVSRGKSILPLETISTQDDPLTRLNLLEQVQGNRDWLATVAADSPADKTVLLSVKKELDQKSYASYLDTDYKGRDVLRIHHIGRDTDIGNGMKDLGFIRGIRHAVDNATAPVQDIVHTVGKVINYTKEDPARLMAGIYLFGDLQQLKTGDSLKSVSGIMALLQSIIFLNYAKDPSEHYLKDIQKTLEQGVAEGKDPFNKELWEVERKSHPSLVDKIDTALKRHPIEIGALTQILGQMSMLTAGGKKIQTTQGKVDMGRSIASIIGWSILMMKGQEVGEKSPWNENPLTRVSQEFKENPNHFASTITTLASVVGLMSPNKHQLMAEASYLVGDATMFFIERGDDKSEAATKVATQFICDSPILFSDSKQTAFVLHVSEYLAERIVMERLGKITLKDHPNLPEMLNEEITTVSQDMAKHIFKELAGKDKKIDKVANTIARLSELFPTAQRDTLEQSLVKTIADLPAVCIEEEELKKSIQAQRDRFITEESPASPPSMTMVSGILAELTFQLPSANAGYNANRLYETVSAVSRTTPFEEDSFTHALTRQATQDVGISEQELRQAANDIVPFARVKDTTHNGLVASGIKELAH